MRKRVVAPRSQAIQDSLQRVFQINAENLDTGVFQTRLVMAKTHEAAIQSTMQYFEYFFAQCPHRFKSVEDLGPLYEIPSFKK